MRIADKMQYDMVRGNLASNRTQMAELQNQAATQKRVTKPSDDPLASSRVLSERLDLQSNKQFSKNLNYAKSFLEYTDQSLGDISEILMRTKDLAIAQANDGSSSENSRRVVASEIAQMHNALVNIGNRKLGDRFIFGGYHTQEAPFTNEGKYIGDSGEMSVPIDKEAFVPMNIPGDRAFLGAGMRDGGLVKQPPPQAKDLDELNKQLGRNNPKVEEKAQKEGKPETQPGPAVRGPASVTGQELKPPTQTPSKASENEIEAAAQQDENGINLFRLLRHLETSLKTNDKVGIQNTLNIIDDALSQVVITRSQVGARSQALENWMQTLERAKVDNQMAISSLEDADVFATISDINRTEATLQATLQTSGKLIQQSLLDFIR